jgi:multidrug efflux pump subunit AcrA (membrane-fusion protein)
LDLNSAVLDVELQDLALKLSTITTPIAGVVTTVTDPFPGVNIFATQTKFEVVNPATIFFAVAADQSEVVSLKEGQEVKIVLDSFPDETLIGKIKSIAYAPETNEVGTLYKIEVEFTNLDLNNRMIRLGMTGDANFVLSEKNDVLHVQNEFLNSDSEGKYLYLGKAGNKVYVQTGLEGETNTEILSGVNAGDTVFNQ